jgi:hypothetical protein
MLSEDLNEQFHIALAVQAAEEIGNMVRRSSKCSDGAQGETKGGI